MSRLALAICTLAFIAALSAQSDRGSAQSDRGSAQSDRGSLGGTISDPNGAPVDEAPIQLKDKASGVLARTASRPDGRYTLAGLAPGAYEFSIVMPCCAYKQTKRDVVLEAGKAAQLNIKLEETVNGSTLGDDPNRLANVMRKRAKFPLNPCLALAESPTCRVSGWKSTTHTRKRPSRCPGPPRSSRSGRRATRKTPLITAAFPVRRPRRGAQPLLSPSLSRLVRCW